METIEKKQTYNELNKAKILKDKVVIDWDVVTVTVTEDSDGSQVDKKTTRQNHVVTDKFNKPHEDFVNAMKMLRKPAIDIGELGSFDQFENYTITGISLSGMDSDEGAAVVITGHKKLERSGQTLGFNTPPTLLGDDTKYADAEKVDKFCARIKTEAFAFALDQKFAKPAQLTLEFEGGEKAEMSVQE